MIEIQEKVAATSTVEEPLFSQFPAHEPVAKLADRLVFSYRTGVSDIVSDHPYEALLKRHQEEKGLEATRAGKEVDIKPGSVVLATSSPDKQRIFKSIIESAGGKCEFEVLDAHLEELSRKSWTRAFSDAGKKLGPKDLPFLSLDKAREGLKRHLDEGKKVFATDTVVFFKGEMLGKPKSLEEARKQIKRVSGKEVKVFVAASAFMPTRQVGFVPSFHELISISLHTRDLSAKDIERYLKMANDNVLTAAGGVDFARPEGRMLINPKNPITVRRHAVEQILPFDPLSAKLRMSYRDIGSLNSYLEGIPEAAIRFLFNYTKALQEYDKEVFWSRRAFE